MTPAVRKAPEPYRVRAHNTSTTSENRIHHDDVAAAYGFRGGLVPGVAVYAYMTRPALETFGPDWLAQGTMAARFVQPFYEGDEVVVTPTWADEDHDVRLALTAARDGTAVGATGHAGLPTRNQPPDPTLYPDVPTPAPDDRPEATEEVFRSLEGLSTPTTTFRAESARAYLDGISDDHALFRDGRIAHPGWLIRSANAVLAANVRLGPWIHTASEVTHHRTVVDGDRIATRARVADLFERKGHRFVVLDVLVLACDEPALHATHTAIYEIAKRG